MGDGRGWREKGSSYTADFIGYNVSLQVPYACQCNRVLEELTWEQHKSEEDSICILRFEFIFLMCIKILLMYYYSSSYVPFISHFNNQLRNFKFLSPIGSTIVLLVMMLTSSGQSFVLLLFVTYHLLLNLSI